MTTTQPDLRDIEPDRVRDLSTDVWAPAVRDGRYLMRIYATVSGRRTLPVLSHLSAARLWGLPVLGPWPREIHLRAGRRRFEESTGEIVWHHDYLPDAFVTEVGGLLVTSRLRTMVDIARSQPVRSAVISGDAALQHRFVTPGGMLWPAIPQERLLDRVRSLPPDRSAARAGAAAAFAEKRSGSSGQSLSRASMRVDFTWEHRFHVKRQALLGEFDVGVEATRDRGREARLAGRAARWSDGAGRMRCIRPVWAPSLLPRDVGAPGDGIFRCGGHRGGMVAEQPRFQ
jgi:hypothetical protein